jgi:membrane fusion protein (multidrug efflux system)
MRFMPFTPLILLSLMACGHGPDPHPAEPKVPIVITHPSQVHEFQQVSVSGTLSSPGNASLVPFLVPGRALHVLVREGEPVGRGQLLAELDSENLNHALEAAHAQVEAARAGARQAEQEFDRMQKMYDSQSLSANDFAKFTAARDASGQQVQQALAGEAAARRNLDDARLQAPIAGFIARRMVEPGVMVAPGQPVFEIAPLDPIEVNVGVPETDVRLVRAGQPARITLPALPGKVFHGTVRLVNVAADPVTRTYMTRISVPNPERELKVGMVAEATIRSDQKLDMVTVLLTAVTRDAQGAPQVFHYFPEQGQVFGRRVELGALLGTSVEIRSGLSGNETLVAVGQQNLRDGMAAQPTLEVK